MYSKLLQRKPPIKQILVYVIMTSAVFVIVTLITLTMLGFRFDANNGNLEQYAFLQFSSIPSGATVVVDGVVLGSKTPNKISVPAGKHKIEMWRDKYETWHKSINVKSGTLTWLNYTLLVPKKLTVESVANYESIYLTLASPKGNYMLIQKQSNKPTFDLVDLSSDTIKSTNITIPADIYSEATTPGINHIFKIEKWNNDERYVLVNHTYGEKSEWLVLDTQNVSQTKNITKLFDLVISGVTFSENSGNTLYAVDSNDIRKLDLSTETISKPLVSNVNGFDVYNESKVITYVNNSTTGVDGRSVGLYREGDEKPSVIRTVTGSADIPLHIATTHYFNEDYVIISHGGKVDVLSGSYPNTTSDNTNSMKVVASFEVKKNIENLMFSPTGEYVFIQSGAYFASYDLEYQKLASSTVKGTGAVPTLKWLDDNYVWSDRDGKLTIREFDGANIHMINSVVTNQDATLTNNGRYLYSIGKSVQGYQLQRVRMILP